MWSPRQVTHSGRPMYALRWLGYVYRMADGRIQNDNGAQRRSAAIPADLIPRMEATSVIKSVAPALASSAKATMLLPSKQFSTPG